MSFLSLVPWYVRALVIVGILAVAGGYGFVRGVEHQEAIDMPKLAAVQAAGDAQAQHTAHAVQQQKQITAEVSSDYAKNMDALGAYYDGLVQRARVGGMRQPAAGGGGAVPAIPQAAAGADAKAGDGLPAGSDPLAQAAVEYAELAGSCAKVTQQLEALQDWVTKQAGVD